MEQEQIARILDVRLSLDFAGILCGFQESQGQYGGK
jgi:hypothetical protein